MGVSFLNFVIFKEFPDYINSLIPSFDKHKEYEIKDFQIVYIEMPKVPVIKKNSTAFEKLIYLLHNADRMEDEMANEIVFEDPALGQIYQDYLKINENHQFISLIEAKEKFWRDTEARKDFIEARKDFFKAEGLAEGLAKGKAEGKAQKLREVVLRLMQRQFSATEIADMVGITPAEVQQIIANQA